MERLEGNILESVPFPLWIQGTELRPSGRHSNHYPLSHLSSCSECVPGIGAAESSVECFEELELFCTVIALIMHKGSENVCD